MNKTDTVYYVQDGKVHTCSYEEFVFGFGKDETTSPRGIENREFIREVDGRWQYCTWGVGGNNFRIVESFETEEEANDRLFKGYLWQLDKNWDAPAPYSTPEEAVAFAFEIDLDVAASVYMRMRIIEEAEDRKWKALQNQLELQRQADEIAARHDRINAGLPANKIEATKAQWTESMQSKFAEYLKRKGIDVVSNRVANSIAWKKQNWFIGGADQCTLRDLIKYTFR